LGEKKGDKVRIFKYRPKSGYAQRAGHRQLLTLLEIESVTLGAAKKASSKKAAAAPEPEEAAAAEADES
jgi:Ribosomal prokaryotic L21 protein